jgi:Rrf2 family protein
MHITARGDYAVQAMLVIAATSAEEELIQAAPLAGEQNIPLSFLQGILLDLVRAGLLHSIRGARGGYRLARAAAEISIGDVLRAVTGELSSVRGNPVGKAVYTGATARLQSFWVSLADGVVQILDSTTLADLRTD